MLLLDIMLILDNKQENKIMKNIISSCCGGVKLKAYNDLQGGGGSPVQNQLKMDYIIHE